MGKLVQILVLLVWTWALVAREATSSVIAPRASDTSVGIEHDDDGRQQPVSRVTISVGETNGFYYKVNGWTYSPFRISVSGEYYNNELAHTGYVRLFLGVDPDIYRYWFQPQPNGYLQVQVWNYADAEFDFEIYAPYPVSSLDMRGSQYNSTALIVTGPSRSAIGLRRAAAEEKIL